MPLKRMEMDLEEGAIVPMVKRHRLATAGDASGEQRERATPAAVGLAYFATPWRTMTRAAPPGRRCKAPASPRATAPAPMHAAAAISSAIQTDFASIALGGVARWRSRAGLEADFAGLALRPGVAGDADHQAIREMSRFFAIVSRASASASLVCSARA